MESREATELLRATCPECGGKALDGLDCQGMFGALLAWEWQDPDLLRVHFLTVSSYQLQHPASLTDEAVRGLQGAFARYLDGEVTTAQIRAQMANTFDGATRVRQSAGDIQPLLRAWSMTVADVYAGGQIGAAARVRAWAQVVRVEGGLEHSQARRVVPDGWRPTSAGRPAPDTGIDPTG